MSITQFITARIYAKKMISFLRMRQHQKKLEKEKIQIIKEKQNAIAQSKRRIPAGKSKLDILMLKPSKKNGQDIIIEDTAEHHDEQSD